MRGMVDDEALITLLTHVQTYWARREVLLVMRTGPDEVQFRAPSELGEFLGLTGARAEEANRVTAQSDELIKKLCWLGLVAASRGECTEFAVTVRRDKNRWGVYFATQARNGLMNLGEKELTWPDDRVWELERQLPRLRDQARLTAAERDGAAITVYKSGARSKLISMLVELADLYRERGQQQEADAAAQEFERLMGGGLMVINPGWSVSDLVAIDLDSDEPEPEPVPNPNPKPKARRWSLRR